jgi:hypothetical protein
MSLKTYFESPKSYWLRWVGVLPIAIIVFVIVSPIVKLGWDITLYFGITFGSAEFIKRYIVAFIAGYFTGNAFIAVGVIIAPQYKSGTALVLLILMVLSLGAIMALGFHNNEYNPWAENVGILIGVLLRYVIVNQEYKS